MAAGTERVRRRREVDLPSAKLSSGEAPLVGALEHLAFDPVNKIIKKGGAI
jgi:hypothetical protein